MLTERAGDRHLLSIMACWSTLSLVLMCAACTESAPTQPTPHTPTSEELERAKWGQVSTVFGFVYEHTAFAVVPVRNFPLAVQGRNAAGSYITADVVTDANGRYEIPDMQREHLEVTARPQDAYVSPCGVYVWGWKDEAYNIHVTSRTNLPSPGTFTWIPPLERGPGRAGYEQARVSSGTVTERTPDGVRPIPEALVELYFIGDSRPMGYTLTRGDGFYDVCQYYANNEYGQEVRVRKAGYQTATKSALFSGLTEFELTRE